LAEKKLLEFKLKNSTTEVETLTKNSQLFKKMEEMPKPRFVAMETKIEPVIATPPPTLPIIIDIPVTKNEYQELKTVTTYSPKLPVTMPIKLPEE
jgi:hypothetical protein